MFVSTMPHNIFETAVIDCLSRCAGNNKYSDWGQQTSRALPLQTSEGGTVFYYRLTKLRNVPKPDQTNSLKKLSERDSVMKGVQALLEEAKRAKQDFESAIDKVLYSIVLLPNWG